MKVEVLDLYVWIDRDICGGCGNCSKVSPGMFELLDEGVSQPINHDLRQLDKVGQAGSYANSDMDGVRVPEPFVQGTIVAIEECPGEVIGSEYRTAAQIDSEIPELDA